MTALDVTFRYAGRLEERQIIALSQAFAIYGVRRIEVDEAGSTITVEYDATRLSNDMVAAVLRRSGINVLERIDRTQAAPAGM